MGTQSYSVPVQRLPVPKVFPMRSHAIILMHDLAVLPYTQSCPALPALPWASMEITTLVLSTWVCARQMCMCLCFIARSVPQDPRSRDHVICFAKCFFRSRYENILLTKTTNQYSCGQRLTGRHTSSAGNLFGIPPVLPVCRPWFAQVRD